MSELRENNRVLIVDDQKEIHDDFDEMLGSTDNALTDELAAAFMPDVQDRPRINFELIHALSGEEAIAVVSEAQLTQTPIAAAYIDIRMPPGIDGIETVRRLHDIDKDIEIVIMTAYTDKRFEDILQDMALVHKLLYMRKPFAREEIRQMTLSLVTKWNIEQEMHRSLNALAVGNERLKAVVDAVDVPVAVFDVSGALVVSNSAFDELHEMMRDDSSRLSDSEANEELASRLRSADAATTSDASPFPIEDLQLHRNLNKEGELYIRAQIAIEDEEGENLGTVVFLRDLDDEIERWRKSTQSE